MRGQSKQTLEKQPSFSLFQDEKGKVVLPSGPVEVATCESKSNRVGQRDLDEGPIGSPRDSSTRLWRRPIVPPSAYPVPTEYPKFQLDYTSVSIFQSPYPNCAGNPEMPASTTRLLVRSFAKFDEKEE